MLYLRATEIDPNDAHAWAGRAATSTLLDESIACWGYALGLAPQDEKTAKALDDCIAERLANCQQGQAGQIIALARTLAQVGLGPQARRLLVCATQLDETSNEAWIWRAGVAENRAEAIQCLERALSLDPEDRKAKAGLDWARALEAQARRLSRSGERAASLVNEGKRLYEAGDKERAHAKFARACELDPTCEEAWVWRGGITTNSDEAIGCMERALAINPENENAKRALALLQVRQLREDGQATTERAEEQAEPPQTIAETATEQAEPQVAVQHEESASEQPTTTIAPVETLAPQTIEAAPPIEASAPPIEERLLPIQPPATPTDPVAPPVGVAQSDAEPHEPLPPQATISADKTLEVDVATPPTSRAKETEADAVETKTTNQEHAAGAASAQQPHRRIWKALPALLVVLLIIVMVAVAYRMVFLR